MRYSYIISPRKRQAKCYLLVYATVPSGCWSHGGQQAPRRVWIKCDNTDRFWSLVLFFSKSFANIS